MKIYKKSVQLVTENFTGLTAVFLWNLMSFMSVSKLTRIGLKMSSEKVMLNIKKRRKSDHYKVVSEINYLTGARKLANYSTLK